MAVKVQIMERCGNACVRRIHKKGNTCHQRMLNGTLYLLLFGVEERKSEMTANQIHCTLAAQISDPTFC